jgi:hypothetical protein
MEIIYRTGTPEDRKAAARFWCEHAGWGFMDEALWDRVFGRTPQGPSLLVLAADRAAGELLGQFIFIPFPVSVDGREVAAYRAFAPVVHTELRLRDDAISLQGIILQMYLHAVETLSNQGAGLIFMVPDPRWARLFAMAPFFATGAFPLMSLPLPEAEKMALPEGYDVHPLEFADPRIDELWEKSRLLSRSMAFRNQVFLQWKNSHRPYQLFAVTDGIGLIGAFVILRKPPDKQALLCDLLAKDGGPALEATLKAACLQAWRREAGLDAAEQALEKISVLAAPLLAPGLKALGFSEEKYKFTLVIHLLDPALPPEALAPDQWYISAND